MDVYQRRRMVALGVIVTFIVIVIAAVAGGGDDETPIEPVAGTTGATGGAGLVALTKEEYVDQADAICADANLQAADAEADTDTEGDDPEIAIRQNELDSLNALVPPDENSATLEEFLAAETDLVDYLERLQLANERGDDEAAIANETRIEEARTAAGTAADEYGLSDCGTFQAPADDGTDTGSATGTDDSGGVAPVTPQAETTPETTVEPTTPETDDESTTPDTDDDSGGVSPDSGGVSP